MNTFSAKTYALTTALLALLLTWSTGAVAQTSVVGRALDQQKGEALGFATVVLKSATPPASVVQSALADEAGRFTLKAVKPGAYELSILMLGYTTHVRALAVGPGNAVLDLGTLALAAETQHLGEVTVTGRRQLLEQKPDRVTMHLDGSVLATGNDTYSILAMAPSVQLVDSRLTFRGKANVLILLNGKRLPGATLENVLASIPGEQLDRIELISNPSAKYDADASGGVIEIYTKRSQRLGWSANLGGNLSQGYRTAGGANGGLQLSTPKIDVVASGGFNRRGGIERGNQQRTLYEGQSPVGQFAQDVDFGHKINQDGSFSGSFNYHPSKQATVGFDLDLVKASLDGAGQVHSVITRPQGLTRSSSANEVSLQVALYNYNLFYKQNLDSLGSNLLLTSNYARFATTQRQTFDQAVVGLDPAQNSTSQFRNYAPATYHIYTQGLDYTKVLNAATQLESGLKYTATRNESQQLAETLTNGQWTAATATPFAQLGYQERIMAGYLNLSHSVGKLTLQAGVRAEQTSYRVVRGIDSSYFNLFPNMRLDHKVSDNYSHSLAYAKNINRPSYENLIPYELFIDNYTSRRGNARLRPEYAHSFSWTHIYKSYSLALAYTQTTNAISSVYLYDQPHLRYILTQSNFRQRHLASATLSVPLAPAKWWAIDNTLGLLYQELSFPNPLDNETTYTKHKTYYTLSSNHTFTLGNNWVAQLYGTYNSPTFSGVLDYGAYSNVTVGLKKTLWNKKASVKLDVSDLFYQANTRESSSVVPVVLDGILRNDTRRVRLAFTYKLGSTGGAKSKQVQTQGNASELNRLGL